LTAFLVYIKINLIYELKTNTTACLDDIYVSNGATKNKTSLFFVALFLSANLE